MVHTQNYSPKVQAYTNITGNEIANQLVNIGTTLVTPNITPRIHVALNTSYQLNGVPTGTHIGTIRNLQAYINKNHQQKELRLAQSKFTFVDKWTSNVQINLILSSHFWKVHGITNTQILLRPWATTARAFFGQSHYQT